MKELAWDELLSVDVEEIDEDHRKLVGIVNILAQAIADGASLDLLGAVFEEFINYTAYHFSHEERLMLKYDYPKYEQHRIEHAGLVESARRLQDDILEGEGTMADEELEFLENWLTEHILTVDKQLGDYLVQVM
jgi:hemerythrin